MTRIQLRRGLASQWTTVDSVLSSGEIGVETDTGKFKIGDGESTWTTLAYATDLSRQPSSVLAVESTGSVPPYSLSEQIVVHDAIASANSKALMPWFAALAGRNLTRANVVCLGASTVEGQGASAMNNRWVSRLAAALRMAYPVAGITGGRGFIKAQSTGEGSFPWPTTINGSHTVDTSLGPQQGALRFTSGSIVFHLNGTSADIMWVREAGGTGVFTYSVDGGQSVSVNTGGSSTLDGNLTRVSLGTAGAHDLSVAYASGDAVTIDGVVEYNGDEAGGIMLHDCGHFGWGTSTWATNNRYGSSGWPAATAALQPGLVIVFIGLNDPVFGIKPAGTTEYLTDIKSTIRAACGASVPFLYAIPAGRTAYPWNGYPQAMWNVALADSGSTVCDFTQRMPAGGQSPSFGLYQADGTHPTDLGHQFMADVLTASLSPA